MATVRCISRAVILLLILMAPLCTPCCPAEPKAQREDASYITTRRDAAIEFIKAMQMDDGSFVPGPWVPRAEVGPYWMMMTTWEAVRALHILGALNAIDREVVIEFLLRYYKNGGCLDPGDEADEAYQPGTLLHALRLLGAIGRVDRDEVVSFVLSMQNPDGGFRFQILDRSSSLLGTRKAIEALWAIGALDVVDRAKVLSFMRSIYDNETGLFRNSPCGYHYDVTDLDHAVLTLYWLDALDAFNWTKTIQGLLTTWKDYFFICLGVMSNHLTTLYYIGAIDEIPQELRDKLISWILKCQSHINGGFVPKPGMANDERKTGVCDTSCAVENLYYLGEVKLLYESFEVEKKPTYYNPPSPPEPQIPPPSDEGADGDIMAEFIAEWLLRLVAITAGVLIGRYISRRRRRSRRGTRRKVGH